MSVPSGFSIDSFVPPPPGWKQSLQQTGSGDNAVVQKVTWTGGRTPSGEDSLFQFLAQPASAKTYTFNVQQTYSDGSIVNWSGPESSAVPAPTIEAKDSLGGGGVSLLTIIALVVGVLGLAAGGLALLTTAARVREGGRWHERPVPDRIAVAAAVAAVAFAIPSLASAHAYLIKTQPAASGVLTRPPDRLLSPTTRRWSPGSRSSRSPTPRPPGDDRAGERSPRIQTPWSCRFAPTCPRAGT